MSFSSFFLFADGRHRFASQLYFLCLLSSPPSPPPPTLFYTSSMSGKGAKGLAGKGLSSGKGAKVRAVEIEMLLFLFPLFPPPLKLTAFLPSQSLRSLQPTLQPRHAGHARRRQGRHGRQEEARLALGQGRPDLPGRSRPPPAQAPRHGQRPRRGHRRRLLGRHPR